jgi:predicted TIM-barrel fold metal-dependent hydrolase
MISHPFEQMLAVLSMICGGILERYPRLRVSFMEAGCSWMPYWLERMDEHYESYGWEAPELTMAPSEYFRRQCAVSCDVYEKGLAYAVGQLGEDCVVFMSDYPHSDGVFPGSVEAIRTRQDLSELAKRKILGGNAVRLLKLSVGQAASAAIV